LIRKISDIFTLGEKLENFNLSQLNGWGEQSISNLLDFINSRRTITLDTFITALGILHVGPHAAKLIADRYKSYESWYEAIAQLSYRSEVSRQLMSIIGIGEEIIASLEEFFSDEDNVKMVDDLAH
jgi:DNA ligase (NAD+)